LALAGGRERIVSPTVLGRVMTERVQSGHLIA
jgi:hypothetical protein